MSDFKKLAVEALTLGVEALMQYGPARDLDEGEQRALGAMQEALELAEREAEQEGEGDG